MTTDELERTIEVYEDAPNKSTAEKELLHLAQHMLNILEDYGRIDIRRLLNAMGEARKPLYTERTER